MCICKSLLDVFCHRGIANSLSLVFSFLRGLQSLQEQNAREIEGFKCRGKIIIFFFFFTLALLTLVNR
jgi:hypothetical protein